MAYQVPFENVYCRGVIMEGGGDGKIPEIKIKGILKESVAQPRKLHYVAAAPPDYRASYTGSGLPFANQSQAFYATPNYGDVEVSSDGEFEFDVMYPNSYYIGLGTVIVPPTVYVEYKTVSGETRNISIKVDNGIPYRMLTYPMQYTRARKDATFYKDGWSMPVRTQEQVLRDSAYPSTNNMADNFWGLKPPM